MARKGRVQGKIAIVTGGGKGIGRTTAELLAREGARVIIADYDEKAGRAAAKAIGRSATFMLHDVRLEEDWQKLVAAMRKKFKRIDILVNNAGIYLIKPLAETTVDDLEGILATNVRGVFLGIKHVAPVMLRQKQGAIVNISSMDGNVGAEGLAAYGASKGAVRTLTKDAALEYAARGVRVNSIHPAYIRTDMARYGAKKEGQSLKQIGQEFPMKRIGEPEDVAYGVLYLASDESRYVTGAELAIDGGALAGS